MKVICIRYNGYDITVGKVYDTIHISTGYNKHYCIFNDNSVKYYYNSEYFITLQEYRNNNGLVLLILNL